MIEIQDFQVKPAMLKVVSYERIIYIPQPPLHYAFNCLKQKRLVLGVDILNTL